jgi:hypothetical protein
MRLRAGFLVSARPGRYTLMVIILFCYVLLSPFTGAGTLANRLINLAIILTMLDVVRHAWPRRQVMALAGLLGVAALLPIFGVWQDADTAGVTSHVAGLCFTLLVICAILSQVLTTEYVTLDTVVGAASVYILIGLLWGALYVLLDFYVPGSFHLPPDFQLVAPSPLAPLMKDTIILYYSFETLTTIGFGDVTPATPPARFFSVSEALVGQLYLAVLVARFVGMQVTHHTARKEP